MTKRLTIDIFSPLPPLRTEISNNTAAFLPALSQLARVRVWTSQTGDIDVNIPGVELQRFSPGAIPFRALNEADATFYTIGNNATFHRDIHAVARRVPGIVILHDTRLQHFFAAYSEREGPDQTYYLDMLERSHGRAMRDKGQAFIDRRGDFQELVDQAPMVLAALSGAVAGVLHNEAEFQALSAQTDLPLYYVPLSNGFGPTPAKAPFRDPGAPLRLIMFGFIGENRRLLPVLEALAAMPDRNEYHLDIYGTVEHEQAADEKIASLGLHSLVTRHGFVPDEELSRALASADLALNLRWPSMGEASASQLRIWSAALPSLVTRVGWYAQLPPETVFMIDHAQEREQIVHHLRALRANPALYAASGERGRRVLEDRHSPELYADAVVKIAASHSIHHARRTGGALAERAAHLLQELVPIELARPLGGHLAARIGDIIGK